MKTLRHITVSLLALLILFSCSSVEKNSEKTAADILGNPDYLAISYENL